MSKAVEVLERFGAKDIEGYTLINNYGYTFTIDRIPFDVRFWANCYGCYIGKWQVSAKTREIDGIMYRPVYNQRKIKELEDALNNEVGDEC